MTNDEVSQLLDQIVMDIQHLELEVIRARYKLSFFLAPLMTDISGQKYSAVWGRDMSEILLLFTINISPTVVLANTTMQSTNHSIYIGNNAWRLVTMIIRISIREPITLPKGDRVTIWRSNLMTGSWAES